MADETPAPLSDAEIAAIDNRYFVAPSAAQWANISERILGEMTELEYYGDAPYIVVRLLATLAERDTELAAYRQMLETVANLPTDPTDAQWIIAPAPLAGTIRALLATPAPGTTGATAGEPPRLACLFDWVRYDAGPALGMIEGEVIRIRHDRDRPPHADVDWHNDDLNRHLAPVPLADLEVIATAREREQQQTAGEEGEA